MLNNRSHKSGTNSTLYKVAMKGFPLSSRIFIWNSPAFFSVMKFPSATSIYLSVSNNEPGIKFEIYGVMWQVAPEYKIQLVRCEVSLEISSRYFCIGIHTCHRHVYLLWLALICTVVWFLIYFCRSVRMTFRLFHIPVNFLFRGVWFQKICNEVILQSISEACIWFLTVTFRTLIVRVVLNEGLFLIVLISSLLFKTFFFLVWSSTLTAPWLRKLLSFCVYYLIVQIQLINFLGRYRYLFLIKNNSYLLYSFLWVTILAEYFLYFCKLSKKLCLNWSSE